MSIIKAARGRITSYHQQDIGRDFLHRGIDIGHGDETADDLRVVAPHDGFLTSAYEGTYGLRAIIRRPDGYWSLLAHLRAGTVIRAGEVGLGQPIAVMGNTGTKYVHLHQEFRSPSGAFLNPIDYMEVEMPDMEALRHEKWQVGVDGQVLSFEEWMRDQTIRAKNTEDRVTDVQLRASNTEKKVDILIERSEAGA